MAPGIEPDGLEDLRAAVYFAAYRVRQLPRAQQPMWEAIIRRAGEALRIVRKDRAVARARARVGDAIQGDSDNGET